MGGGGAIGMMNATIRNNRNLLKRKKSLKEIYKSREFDFDKKTELDFPEAHPSTIKLIGECIRRENRELRIKQWIVFGIIMSVLLAVFLNFI